MSIVRVLHVAAGVLALILLWVPLFTLKGGRAHRRAGWIFAACMGVISVTALVLVAPVLVGLARSEVSLRQAGGGLFLGYVSLLAATSCAFGLRVLRQKDRKTPTWHVADVGLPVLLLLGSLAIAAVGLRLGNALFIGFPLVGLGLSATCLLVFLRAPSDRWFWWFSHMGGMIGSSIATITAFLVVNQDRVRKVLPLPGLLLWLLPTLIGVPLLLTWQARYRREFRARSASATSQSRP